MKKLSSTLLELSTILDDCLYHDGDTIGRKLNVTRSAVWKAIKKLEEYGVDISSVKGKGYTIREPLGLLDEVFIQKEISNKNIPVAVFETIDSTSTYLKNYIGHNVPRVCIAEYQTQGRGRLSRDWYSPFGKNIYLSLLFPFQKDMSDLSGMSIAVGLALTKAFEYLNIEEKIGLKWPNDVLCDNKKLVGSLVEIISEANGMTYAIIGIGINVNMMHDSEHIGQRWISLKQILNRYVDRNKLCVSVIDTLLNYLKKFNDHGLDPFLSEWNTQDVLLNKKVKLMTGNQPVTGVVRGINTLGNLMIEVETGYIKPFSSGDTTIVKE